MRYTPEQLQALVRKQCTDKRAYSTKKIAKEAIKAAHRGGAMMDYYQCSICAKYHLTRKNKKGSPR